MTYTKVAKAINQQANPVRAGHSQRFFRTGKGEYAEGDVFLGLTVPQIRIIAKTFNTLGLKHVERLLKNKHHEFRLTAIFILVSQYQQGDEKQKKLIVDFYKKHFAWVNNWDLVDSSAHKILGDWLLERDKKELYHYARSKHLWTRRIAIIATASFIAKGKLTDTFALSEILLHDDHDLIHKAVGWMLREAGKKDVIQLEAFLQKHYKAMPRTMLRYAIEKFPEQRRQMYLKGFI